jgi:hypothetical protein
LIPSVRALANFVGTSGGGGGGGARVNISNQTIIGTATAAYKVNSSGTVSDHTNTNLETWKLSGVAGDYDIMVTVSGNALSGSATGTWLNLATGRSWSYSVGVGGLLTGTLTVQIRDAVTLTVLDTATVNLTADNS